MHFGGADPLSYLTAAGLVDMSSPAVNVREEWRRNYILRVTQSEGPSYFVKLTPPGEDPAYIAREIALYARVASDDRLSDLRSYLPHVYMGDPGAGLLVLEQLAGHRTLREHHMMLGRFPVSVARHLGKALGQLHTLTTEQKLLAEFEAAPAWVLGIHHPPLYVLDTLSSASIELIKTVQRYPELGNHLDDLRRQWSEDCLAHFDLGWDNCLLASGGLKLLDWEFCGAGDPCWDAGCVFAAYLTFWVQSMPVNGVTPPQELLAKARHPIEKMQPAIRAFWDAYSRATAGEPRLQERLLKAVRFCAARLLEVAYAETQSSQALSAHVLVLTQLCLNILRRPDETAAGLLGIAPDASDFA